MWSKFCGKSWKISGDTATYSNLKRLLLLELSTPSGDDNTPNLRIVKNGKNYLFRANSSSATEEEALLAAKSLLQKAIDAELLTVFDMKLTTKYSFLANEFPRAEAPQVTPKIQQLNSDSKKNKPYKSLEILGCKTFEEFIHNKFTSLSSFDVNDMTRTIGDLVDYLGDDFPDFWRWAKRTMPRIHNPHTKEAIGDLSEFHQHDYPKFYSWSLRYGYKAKAKKLKDEIEQKYGENLIGLELSNDSGSLVCVLLPDASEPGRYRYSVFSENGFLSHVTKDSYAEVLQDAIDSGYRNFADGSLRKLSGSPEFVTGNEFQARLDSFKSGEIDWKTFNAINLFESTPAPYDDLDVGKLKLTKDNMDEWIDILESEGMDVNKAKKELLSNIKNNIDGCISEASYPQDSIQDMELSLGFIEEYLKQGVSEYDKTGVDRIRNALATAKGRNSKSLEESTAFKSGLYGRDEVATWLKLTQELMSLNASIEEGAEPDSNANKHVRSRMKQIGNVIELLDSGNRLIDIDAKMATVGNVDVKRSADQKVIKVESPPAINTDPSTHDYMSTKVINTPIRNIKTAFTKIDSIEKAAHLCASYRKSSQEYFLAIVTNNNDEVLQVIEHAKGNASSAIIDLSVLAGSIFDVDEGANFWLVHNHPSETKAASPFDIKITNAIETLAEGSMLNYKGHAILTGGMSAVSITSGSDKKSEAITILAGVRNQEVPVTERVFRRRSYIGVDAIGDEQSAQKLINIVDHKNAAILLNAALMPVGVISLDHGGIDKLKGTGGVERILKAVHKTNACSVLLKVNNETGVEVENAKNLAGLLSSINTKVIDWFESAGKGEQYRSVKSHGSHSEIVSKLSSNGFYRKLAAEDSPGNRLEQVKEWVKVVESDTGVAIQVVADETMLPVRIQKHLSGPVSGIYDMATKTPYVIASQIDNEEHAIKVALHEGLGHFGIISFLERNAEYGGTSVESVLDDIYSDIGPSAIEKLIGGYSFDLTTASGRRESVLEYIAHIAEDNSNSAPVLQVTSSTNSMLSNMYSEVKWSPKEILGLIEAGRCFSLMENVTRVGTKASTFEERAISRRKAYSAALASMNGQLRKNLVGSSLGIEILAGGEYFNGFASSLIINDSWSNKGIDGFYTNPNHSLDDGSTLELNNLIKDQAPDVCAKLSNAGLYDRFVANSYELIIKDLGNQNVPRHLLDEYISISDEASLNYSIANMSGLEFYGYLEENLKYNDNFHSLVGNWQEIKTPSELLRGIGISGISIRSLAGNPKKTQYLTLTDDLAMGAGEESPRFPNAGNFRDLVRSFQEDELANARPIDHSKAFKKWIGKSKAVNSDGSPKVLFYQSTGGFIAFSDSPIITTSNAGGSSLNSHPVPVYINATNPYFPVVGELIDDYQVIKSLGYDSIYQSTAKGDEWKVFDESQVRSAINNAALNKFPRVLEKKVFHGSPYKFDRFDLASIGGGEGAQSYGWGIYLAGKKQVAEFYQKALSAQKTLGVPKSRYIGENVSAKEMAVVKLAYQAFNTTLNAHKLDDISVIPEYWSNYYGFYNAINTIGEKDREYYEANKQKIESKIEIVRSKIIEHDPLLTKKEVEDRLEGFGYLGMRTPYAKAYEAAVKEIESYGSGYLYEIEIPTDENLITWDVELREMNPGIVSKLTPITDYLKAKPLNDITLDKLKNKTLTGEELYRYLSAELSLEHKVNIDPEGKELAAIALGAEGVQGLKYWDTSTFDPGNKEKECNYVIWDLEAIESIKDHSHEASLKSNKDFSEKRSIKSNLVGSAAFLATSDALGISSKDYKVTDGLANPNITTKINSGPIAMVEDRKVGILKDSVETKLDIEKLLLGVAAQGEESLLFEKCNQQVYSKFWLEMGQLEGIKSASKRAGLTLLPFIDHAKEMMIEGKITPDQRVSIVTDEFIAQAILGENYKNINENEKDIINKHIDGIRCIFDDFKLNDLREIQSSEIVHLMKQANLSKVAINNGHRPELIIPAASGILYYKWQKAVEAEVINQHGLDGRKVFTLMNDMRNGLREGFVNSVNPHDFVINPEIDFAIKQSLKKSEIKADNNNPAP